MYVLSYIQILYKNVFWRKYEVFETNGNYELNIMCKYSKNQSLSTLYFLIKH